jgi:hypothetical protein
MTCASEGSPQPGLRFARDEEAAGSNPVTRTGTPAGQRPTPSGRPSVWQVPQRTIATVLIEGTRVRSRSGGAHPRGRDHDDHNRARSCRVEIRQLPQDVAPLLKPIGPGRQPTNTSRRELDNAVRRPRPTGSPATPAWLPSAYPNATALFCSLSTKASPRRELEPRRRRPAFRSRLTPCRPAAARRPDARGLA